MEPSGAISASSARSRGIDRIQLGLLSELCERARPLLLVSFGITCLVVVGLWEVADHIHLLIWAGSINVLAVLRLGMAYWFRSGKHFIAAAGVWTSLFALAAGIAGVAWGSAVFLLENLSPQSLKMILVFFLVALGGGAIIGHAKSPAIFYAFTLPAVLPYGFRLSYLDGTFSGITAAGLALVLGLACAYAHHLHQSAVNSITFHHRMERLMGRLDDARDKAERASMAKTRFLANMSHELRTPLNAIIGFSELMMQDTHGGIADPRFRTYVRDIHASGAHLRKIIDQILEVAELETDKIELNERHVDTAELLDEVIECVQPAARAGTIKVELDASPSLPPLHADRSMIKRALTNIIINALERTPANGRVYVSTQREAGGGLSIGIEDNGAGFAAKELELMLRSYSILETREHTLRDRRANSALDGSDVGLALAQAKLIVERHGGLLTINSQVGKGTRVVVWLPRERLEGAAAVESEIENRMQARENSNGIKSIVPNSIRSARI